MELLASSDWQLSEEIDTQLQTPICRIFTGKTNSPDPTELSIQFPKDPRLLPYISLKKKSPSSALISIKISDRESQNLFLWKAAASAEESNLFWYAPVKISALLEQIRAKNELEIFLDPKGTPQSVKISLRGSSNALDQAAACLKNTKFPKDFFALLNKEKANLVPDLGDRSVQVMVQAVQSAYDSYLNGQNINVALANLRKPVAPLLQKEARALKTTNEAKSAMDTAQTKSDAANKLLSDLQSAISNGKAELEALKTQKTAADQDLAAKLAVYQPLKAQMKPFEDKVKAANTEVRTLQNQISEDESTIANNQRRIRQLRNELSDISSAIPRLQSEVSRLESDLWRAESNMNSYDVSRETQKILDNDWSYRNLRSDLDNKRRDRDRSEWDFRDADRRADGAKRRLEDCRRTPEANCSSQESEYQSADRERDNARRKMNSLDSDISWIQTQMNWKESSARSSAQSEYDSLRRIRDSIASDVNGKRSELNGLFNRQSEINNTIPRLRREISDAENELPGLRTRLQTAQQNLQSATQEKDSFAQSIGFPAAEANYFAAKALAEKLVKDIASKTAEIAKSEKALPGAQKTAQSRLKGLERAKAEYVATLPALQKIQEQLKPFRIEEAKLLESLAIEEAKFKESQAKYQDLYKLLSEA